MFLCSCNSIKTYEFCTQLFPLKTKGQIKRLDQLYFIKMKGQDRYIYIIVGRDISYFKW